MSEIDRINRFWKKVDKSGNCWIWTGDRTSKGYGRISKDGVRIGTHRYSWLIHNGTIPKGLCVCHTCDNPPCVNPDHLWLGTNLENQQDMTKKGRRVINMVGLHSFEGRKLQLENVSRGERHIRSKFTNNKIYEVRALWETGYTINGLARTYGVAVNTMNSILKRKTWKHI